MDESELRRIGWRARDRVLAEHTAQHRAEQFEEYVNAALTLKELDTVPPATQRA
jgi:hypothetical protein